MNDRVPFVDAARLTGVRIAVVFGLLVPVALAWTETIRRLSTQATTAPLFTTIAAVVVVALGVGAMVIAHRRAYWPQLSPIRFVAIAVAIGVALRVGYLLIVNPEPVSDFGRMWQSAIDLAAHGWPTAVDDTLGERFARQRTLPYFLPLVWVFGASHWVFKIANVIAFAGSQLLVYALARRWFDERAARMAIVVLLFVPETFFASAIPTHDVPGALLLLTCFLLFDFVRTEETNRSWRRAAIGSLILGLALAILEIQRMPALFFFLAVAGWLIFRRVRWTQIVLVLVLPLLVQQTVTRTMRDSGYTIDADGGAKLQAMWIAANNDSWSDGSFASWYENYFEAYGGYTTNRGLTTSEWQRLAYPKFFSDLFEQPAGRTRLYGIKAKQLYTLGDQPGFYLPTGKTTWRGVDDAFGRPTLIATNRLTTILWLPFLLLIGWRTMRMHRVADGPLLILLYCALYPLVLMLIGQCQARYLYWFWFVAPLLLASTHRSTEADAPVRRVLGQTLLGSAGLAAILALAAITTSGAKWRLLRFSESSRPYQRVVTGNEDQTWSVPADARSLSVFARRPYVPPAKRKVEDAPVRASIASGSQQRTVDLVEGAPGVLIELPLEHGKTVDIHFTVGPHEVIFEFARTH